MRRSLLLQVAHSTRRHTSLCNREGCGTLFAFERVNNVCSAPSTNKRAALTVNAPLRCHHAWDFSATERKIEMNACIGSDSSSFLRVTIP
ncbi:hypothetical protein SAMN05192539_1015131 [Paraburkholderia diazotrophica]|uniref:Uncharacterized protein n=1 Tax=Paraburkholderia diazotrophica TaxID=667676 RepID=A0A1H7AS76_9BURK|nr:hypothetical protein SAMN05192539_1015131 [Paraburkholderia diazotrophica]